MALALGKLSGLSPRGAAHRRCTSRVPVACPQWVCGAVQKGSCDEVGPSPHSLFQGRCLGTAHSFCGIPRHLATRQLRRLTRRAAHSANNIPGSSTLDCAEPSLLFADPSQAPCSEDLQEILPLLTPKQLADAIWGFAKKNVKPTNDFMSMIAQEVRSKLEHFRSQDLSNTLWALAVLKYEPDSQWWGEFERQVYKNVTDFSGRELANMLWAMAILDRKPAWILDSLLTHAADSCFASCSANSMHLIIWSVGKLGWRPSQEWLQSFLRTTQANFFSFSPSEMSSVIWALAKLGCKLSPMWLDNFLMVAQWRFPSFGAKQLSILVWAAAMMDHRPSQEWLLCFEEQVREKFSEFGGQELACIAWALRKFGYSAEDNAVFYMLERQDRFLEVDYQVLSNSKLLSHVLSWRGGQGQGRPSSSPLTDA